MYLRDALELDAALAMVYLETWIFALIRVGDRVGPERWSVNAVSLGTVKIELLERVAAFGDGLKDLGQEVIEPSAVNGSAYLMLVPVCSNSCLLRSWFLFDLNP